MKKLLGEGFDAVFVGSGAPKGGDIDIPGRHDDPRHVHVGIQWLESVAFRHIDSIGERVLIIGAGNTAMDCCRTSLRLGGKDVRVMARKPRNLLKASNWELEDAEEERVEIMLNHSPERFIMEDGRLVGMEFARVRWDEDDSGRLKATTLEHVTLPCDDVVIAVGQENAFPFIEDDCGIEFGRWNVPKVDPVTFQSTREGVFFGGDSAFGPKNIIWAVEHGHQAAISIHKYCQGESISDRPAQGMRLTSTKMGIHEWSYSNDFNPAVRRLMPQVDLASRFKNIDIEVELGFTPEQTLEETERCLNCDVQTVFTAKLCIECDACIDICPVDCLTITANAAEEELRQQLRVPAENLEQEIFVSESLPQTKRVMVKDENVCVHCGLCAERCPTSAWDMQKSTLRTPHAADGQPADQKAGGSK
jgi:ferredoxin